MTFYITEADLTVQFAVNLPNLTGTFDLVITSQYAKKPFALTAVVTDSNDRYSQLITVFPTGFGDEHKNGVYYWDLIDSTDTSIERGLVKIITEPGGDMGTVSYDSGVETEHREADVYYRPNF